MAWIDTVPDLCRTFKTPRHREDRQRQAGNFGGMAYEYAWKAFGRYNSHILYPEMLFSFRLDRRFLFMVETYLNQKTNELMADITEIVGYASALLYVHEGQEEKITATKRLLEVEKAIQMGEGRLYLRADYSAVSRLYTEQYGLVDPNAKARIDLTRVNLPPTGSSHGPYPAVKALFWDREDARAYRDSLIKTVYDAPRSLVYMGDGDFTFSPVHFGETP